MHTKQTHKIRRENFQALPSYHILGVVSFFSRTLYIYGTNFRSRSL